MMQLNFSKVFDEVSRYILVKKGLDVLIIGGFKAVDNLFSTSAIKPGRRHGGECHMALSWVLCCATFLNDLDDQEEVFHYRHYFSAGWPGIFYVSFSTHKSAYKPL